MQNKTRTAALTNASCLLHEHTSPQVDCSCKNMQVSRGNGGLRVFKHVKIYTACIVYRLGQVFPED